jgi:endonuclease YncB( thermonuclease family)
MFPSFCVALFLGFAFSVYAETYMGYVVAKEQSPDDRQQFENAEIRAQAERVGLWSEKIRIPQEMWRRGLRTTGQPCDNCPKLCHSITSR